MEHIQPYLDYFAQHPGWAIAIVFLIAFGEALLIIGLFVPSTAVLVGAGMLVGTGHLEFWPVFVATAVGAILGDQFSYWAGRLFGDRLKICGRSTAIRCSSRAARISCASMAASRSPSGASSRASRRWCRALSACSAWGRSISPRST